ncbi:hypothetical protein [Planctomycetes bacterium K23_9]|uniref:Uncharacterized protein n=1 Tax=Stieleria marina TaxID=1930275 RepID=A0A517NTD6_9BACT|nr:hypothetical protein K239x_23380 [Planctomycetes bacterium K23_9]
MQHSASQESNNKAADLTGSLIRLLVIVSLGAVFFVAIMLLSSCFDARPGVDRFALIVLICCAVASIAFLISAYTLIRTRFLYAGLSTAVGISVWVYIVLLFNMQYNGVSF